MKNKKNVYKISEFRSIYSFINSINHDYKGLDMNERLIIDLRSRYAEALKDLSQMIPSLHTRFVDDLELAKNAILQANKQIELNELAQSEAIKDGISGEIFNPAQTKLRFVIDV